MAKKYRLNDFGGVVLVARGQSIPEDERNHDWQQYIQWVADGNTPDPVPAAPAKSTAELLYDTDQQMIRVIDWLLEFIVTNGSLPTLADVPNKVKQLYQERKALRALLP